MRSKFHSLSFCGCALFYGVLFLQLAGCGEAPAPHSTSNNGDDARHVRSAATAERYDLARDEERGGHTLEKHVGRTDEQLEERLRRERNISAASTWTDRETAEVAVAEALHAERGRVERWTQRGYPRANLALHYDAGHVIGRSLQRVQDQAVNCSNAVIVLRANGPDSFYVLTAYPEVRE
ncbi:MAG: RNase A-like domain-containing protein [Candidatus Acidiferrum sp.]